MNEIDAAFPDAASRPLILVGMMGAGKSTAGRKLARRLGRGFVDSDKVLEERCGVSVSTIFELEGEDGFRRREAALLDEFTRLPSIVLATGGGAVLAEANRQMLRERGFVIYLKASPADLWQRLRRDRTRPLLRTANPRERLVELLAAREPLYESVAHAIVPTARQPIEQLVTDIIDRLPDSRLFDSRLPDSRLPDSDIPPA